MSKDADIFCAKRLGMISMLKRYVYILKFCIQLDATYFCMKLALTIFTFVSSAITLLLPKYLLSSLSQGNFRDVTTLMLIILVVSLLSSTIKKLTSPIIAKRREKMNSQVIDAFLRKSINLNLSFFDERGNYDKYALVFNQCCSILQNSIDILCSLLSASMQFALVIYVLAWVPSFVLIVLCALCIYQTYISHKINEENYTFQKQQVHHNKKINYIYRLFYTPEFMRDIRINDIKEFIFRKKDSVADTIIRESYEITSRVSTKQWFIALLSSVENFITYLYFSFNVINKTIWYDDFIVSLNAYNQLKATLLQIISATAQLTTNDLYIKDYISFMDSPLEIHGGSRELLVIDQIDFRNVSFKYPNDNRFSLKNITFSITANEKVAIIGKNGAGKTTIVKLLLRLYDPTEGTILINNINIEEYSISSLRKAMSVIFQDYSTYAFSIEENLTLGSSASDKEIIYALKQVNMYDKIFGLPKGTQSPITSQLYDDGIELSGGEKQRLALARIYLWKRAVTILDEPTSSLDPFVENSFYEKMLSDYPGTLIIISHRITFSYRMSRIISLEDGTIKEIGTPTELLQKPDSLYKEMYDLNTKKYINKN